MFFVTYVILFIGCLTITTMIHALTIHKIERSLIRAWEASWCEEI